MSLQVVVQVEGEQKNCTTVRPKSIHRVLSVVKVQKIWWFWVNLSELPEDFLYYTIVGFFSDLNQELKAEYCLGILRAAPVRVFLNGRSNCRTEQRWLRYKGILMQTMAEQTYSKSKQKTTPY